MSLRAATLLLAAALAAAQEGLEILTEPCVNASAPSYANQTFILRNCAGGACLYASGAYSGFCVSGGTSETNLVLAKCDPSNAAQQFVFQAATGAIAQMPLSVKQWWNVFGGVLEPPGTNIQVRAAADEGGAGVGEDSGAGTAVLRLLECPVWPGPSRIALARSGLRPFAHQPEKPNGPLSSLPCADIPRQLNPRERAVCLSLGPNLRPRPDLEQRVADVRRPLASSSSSAAAGRVDVDRGRAGRSRRAPGRHDAHRRRADRLRRRSLLLRHLLARAPQPGRATGIPLQNVHRARRREWVADTFALWSADALLGGCPPGYSARRKVLSHRVH